MHPVHDHDPLLLLATALASKRRPAEPVEVVAAIELMQVAIPPEGKLLEAIARLGAVGLLLDQAGGLALTAAAQEMIQSLSLKDDYPAKLFDLRRRLGDYQPVAAEPITQAAEVWHTAVLAQQAAGKSTAKNLLMPKPAAPAAQARPGQRQRKPLPKSRKR